MPQVFDAVRCARCESFQVIQRTLKPKFDCKLCGERQSVTRIFGSGAAREVRPIVQKLNAARGAAARATEEQREREWQELPVGEAAVEEHAQAHWSDDFSDEAFPPHPAFQRPTSAHTWRWGDACWQDGAHETGQGSGQGQPHDDGFYQQRDEYHQHHPRHHNPSSHPTHRYGQQEQAVRCQAAPADDDESRYVTELPVASKAGSKKRAQRCDGWEGAGVARKRHTTSGSEPGRSSQTHRGASASMPSWAGGGAAASFERRPAVAPPPPQPRAAQNPPCTHTADENGFVTSAAGCAVEEEVWED